MTLTDFPELRALSAREKLELVDELWLSAAPELNTLEVSGAEKTLLDERWAAFLKNPASALTVEEFKAKLKAPRA
jgi:putative addiction module component (TIGR02574 family)